MDVTPPTSWLDLPPEVRMLVYVHYFRAKTIHLHPHCIDDWLFECYSSEDEGEVMLPGGPRLKLINGTIPRPGHSSLRALQVEPLALLCTSKLVRREAEPVFWKETTFEFENRSSHYINDPKVSVDIKVMHLRIYNDDSHASTLEDWLSNRFAASNVWMDELAITGFPLTSFTNETFLSLLIKLSQTQVGRLSFVAAALRDLGPATQGRRHFGGGIQRSGRITLRKARRGFVHAPTQDIADSVVEEIEAALGSRLPVELDWIQDNFGM